MQQDYQGIKVDIFAIGVVLFILVLGHFPFSNASLSDKYYKLIWDKNYVQFWKTHDKS